MGVVYGCGVNSSPPSRIALETEVGRETTMQFLVALPELASRTNFDTKTQCMTVCKEANLVVPSVFVLKTSTLRFRVRILA